MKCHVERKELDQCQEKADKNQSASQAFTKYLLSQCYVPTTVLCAKEKDNVLRTLNASGKRQITKKVNRTISVQNECYENKRRW